MTKLLGKPQLGLLVGAAASLPHIASASPREVSQEPSPTEDLVENDELGNDVVVDGQPVDELKDDLAERLTNAGYVGQVRPDQIHVYDRELGAGTDYIAATQPVRFKADGTLVFDRGEMPETTETAAADPAFWATRPGDPTCVLRLQNDAGGWFDACYEFLKLENDGDKNNDHHALQVEGTGNNANALQIAAGRDECCNFIYDEWNDWDPAADVDYANCVSGVTLGIDYIATVSWTQQRCETWDIDKGVDPGVFTVNWRNNTVANSGNRELAMVIAGEVPQGEPFRFPYLQTCVHSGFSSQNCQTIQWI